MPYADRLAAATASTPHSTRHQQLVYVVCCAVAGGVLGVPAGLLWLRLAEPPSAALTSAGVYFGDIEQNQQVGVTLWFFVVGVAVGLVAGLVVGSVGHRHGLAAVAAVLAMCATAALVTKWTGADLFGPNEQAQLADAHVGSEIAAQVEIGTPVAYLGWPIGGLLGGLAAMFGWPRPRLLPTVPAPSSSVSTHRVQ